MILIDYQKKKDSYSLSTSLPIFQKNSIKSTSTGNKIMILNLNSSHNTPKIFNTSSKKKKKTHHTNYQNAKGILTTPPSKTSHMSTASN